jgi:hypothetical protein
MSDASTEAKEEPLAFDRAEFAAPEDAAPACAICKRPLGDEYFTINAAIACDDCHHLLATQVKESKTAGAFMRAAGYGLGAAIAGSIAWYAVARITGMEIGLVAIAIGYVVGKAVRHGARGPGARRYQALAMLLTYLSITGSYVPLVIKGLSEPGDDAKTAPATAPTAATRPAEAAYTATPKAAPPGASSAAPGDPAAAPREHMGPLGLVAAFIVVIGISLAAPFLSGASNIIGILLIGIALYEAWKFNKPVPIAFEGPLRTKRARREEPLPSTGT